MLVRLYACVAISICISKISLQSPAPSARSADSASPVLCISYSLLQPNSVNPSCMSATSIGSFSRALSSVETLHSNRQVKPDPASHSRQIPHPGSLSSSLVGLSSLFLSRCFSLSQGRCYDYGVPLHSLLGSASRRDLPVSFLDRASSFFVRCLFWPTIDPKTSSCPAVLAGLS